MINNYITKDILEIDLNHSFFHYTSRQNLDSIFENGLEPRIGENSMYVEKTPKIFFVEGEKGIITIMDVWLRWLTGKLTTSKFKYWFGTTIYMKIPFCIKSIPVNMVKKSLKSQEKRFLTYKKMKSILENSVFLILDLEENIDFDYNDIDDVKNTYYESFLKLLYPQNSNLKDKRVEYWNLQTYPNKVISPEKISLLKVNNSINSNDILIYIIERNIEYIKDNHEFLYEYYVYVKNTIKKDKI